MRSFDRIDTVDGAAVQTFPQLLLALDKSGDEAEITYSRLEDGDVVSGALKLTRTVRLYLSNLSGQPRTLTVIERIPVSELEDVDIELLPRARRVDAKADSDADDDHAYEPTTPPSSRDDDGFVRFELTLPPSSTRTLTLAWRLKAPSKVQINL